MKYPNTKKYSENHIFDEDKSVKRNKEMVLQKNDEIAKQIKEYKVEKNRLHTLFREDIMKSLVKYYNVNEKIAEVIYNKIYNLLNIQVFFKKLFTFQRFMCIIYI